MREKEAYFTSAPKSLESLDGATKKTKNAALAGGPSGKPQGKGIVLAPSTGHLWLQGLTRPAGQPRPWTVQPLCGGCEDDLPQ